MKLRAIILGCGSSGGVPRIGGEDGSGDWGDCDPANSKNRRSRSSIIVQRAHETMGWDTSDLTTILVDTSPDLRSQLIDNKISRLDAVLYTHDHADQSHGIDDLRVFTLRQRARVPVYVDPEICASLLDRFRYCFYDNPKTGYPAILDKNNIPQRGECFEVDGPSGPIPITSVQLTHGAIESLGFVFGDKTLAYSPDVNDISDASFDILTGTTTWIADALRYKPHVSHAHLEQTLQWFERADVNRGVLTNLHIDLDYERVSQETPNHVSPAYDGMIIESE